MRLEFGEEIVGRPAGRPQPEPVAGGLQADALPLSASEETARLFAKPSRARVRPVSDLGNVQLGLWEGLLAEDLEEKCPTLFRQWKDDPASVSAPSGETIGDAEDRIIGALAGAMLRLKPEVEAVGVVLRPEAMAMVGCGTIAASAAVGPRAITVTTGSEVVSAANAFDVLPSFSLNPNSGTRGQKNLNVTFTGQGTHFAQGTSQVSFGGAGITVNSVTVTSATSTRNGSSWNGSAPGSA